MPKTADVLTVDAQIEATSQVAAKLAVMAQDILALPYTTRATINTAYSSAAELARARRKVVRVLMDKTYCSRYLAHNAFDALRAAGLL